MDFAGKSGSVSSTAAKKDKSRNISVTFEEPIVTKTEELAKMEVLSKELDIPAEIKEDGLFKLPIFTKYRRRHIKQLLYIQSICLRFLKMILKWTMLKKQLHLEYPSPGLE